jgi:hypothetical protein
MNAASIKKMLYDPMRDFTPIGQVTRANWVLAANPALKAATLKELVALARTKPRELNYGSSGIGGASHLAMEMFAAPLELRLTHIPYKGTGQAVADVVEGRVQLVIGDQPTLMPHFKSGRLKGIAVTGATRSPRLPELPSLSEVVPGFDVQPWQGLFGPAGHAGRPCTQDQCGACRRTAFAGAAGKALRRRRRGSELEPGRVCRARAARAGALDRRRAQRGYSAGVRSTFNLGGESTCA